MEIEIKNCINDDLAEILLLYESARKLQKERKMVIWPSFDKSFLEKEIKEERQWKLIFNNAIACNWAITFEDKEIWGQRDKANSIYIHRICTNPIFYGNRYIDKITDWAKLYAIQKQKKFVRLDTLGNNTKLIKHYISAGFKFLGMVKLTDTANLPAHYQMETSCCLFEIDLETL